MINIDFDNLDLKKVGYPLLGFMLPIVGLILWFVWKDCKQDVAKQIINGAVVGIVMLVMKPMFSMYSLF